MKECKKCNKIKPLIKYAKDPKGKDGYRTDCKDCKAQYKRKYYLNNKNNELLKSKIWRDNNKDHIKNYYNINKVKILTWNREYQKKRRSNDIGFKLKKNLRTRLYIAIKNNQKIGSAIDDLGCTIEELKKHLESQFKEGMNWDNWSREGWHIDHIKPLASFDLGDESQLKRACNYTNLQPLWAKDNLSKSDV